MRIYAIINVMTHPHTPDENDEDPYENLYKSFSTGPEPENTDENDEVVFDLRQEIGNNIHNNQSTEKPVDTKNTMTHMELFLNESRKPTLLARIEECRKRSTEKKQNSEDDRPERYTIAIITMLMKGFMEKRKVVAALQQQADFDPDTLYHAWKDVVELNSLDQ